MESDAASLAGQPCQWVPPDKFERITRSECLAGGQGVWQAAAKAGRMASAGQLDSHRPPWFTGAEFWLQPADLTRFKAEVIKHLPILIFGDRRKLTEGGQGKGGGQRGCQQLQSPALDCEGWLKLGWP